MVLAGIVILGVALTVGSYPDPDAPDGDSLYKWAVAVLVMGIVVLVSGLIALQEWDNRRRFARGDRRERIRRLTESLREAMQPSTPLGQKSNPATGCCKRLKVIWRRPGMPPT